MTHFQREKKKEDEKPKSTENWMMGLSAVGNAMDGHQGH